MDQNTKDILETVGFIKDHMLTKEEAEDRFTSVEAKLAGIERRLDAEAMQRADEKIPGRTSDLEVKVFGKSRAPQV